MTRDPGRWTFGFDADDTLWQNERFFQETQALFAGLMADHTDGPDLAHRLIEAERRNIGRYGFGIKGFVLSMIETAIEVTDARVPAATIRRIIEIGQDMLEHPVDLLPGARIAVESLRDRGEIVLITKGDLLDQQRKLARSGLAPLFDAIEIVSDKRDQTYARIFARHGADQALMTGNSVKSDILPALAAGAWGVLVPSSITWALDHAEPPTDHPKFHRIDSLADLPGLVATLP